jgi:hypothetical protein
LLSIISVNRLSCEIGVKQPLWRHALHETMPQVKPIHSVYTE